MERELMPLGLSVLVAVYGSYSDAFVWSVLSHRHAHVRARVCWKGGGIE